MHLLLVNPTWPRYDRDSGSFRLFQLLRLLVEEGHRVTFAPRDVSEPEPYRTELEGLGVEILELPSTGAGNPGGHRSKAILSSFLRSNEVDVAVLYHHRMASRLISRIRRDSPRTMIAIDCVDLHFRRLRRQALVTGAEEDRLAAEREERRELETYRRADLVIAISREEAAMLRPLLPGLPVTTVPNIHPPADNVPGFLERKDLFFVGSFGHPPNVDALEILAQEVMPRVRERLPEVRLHVAGSGASLPEGTQGIELLGFVDDLDPWIRNSRLLVAPLRFGAGAKGKVGQALSYGLPVVTTPIGVEGLGLRSGENVLVGHTAGELAALVVRAYQDRAQWERLSDGGRGAVAPFHPRRVLEDFVQGVLRSPALARAAERRPTLLGRVFGR